MPGFTDRSQITMNETWALCMQKAHSACNLVNLVVEILVNDGRRGLSQMTYNFQSAYSLVSSQKEI